MHVAQRYRRTLTGVGVDVIVDDEKDSGGPATLVTLQRPSLADEEYCVIMVMVRVGFPSKRLILDGRYVSALLRLPELEVDASSGSQQARGLRRPVMPCGRILLDHRSPSTEGQTLPALVLTKILRDHEARLLTFEVACEEFTSLGDLGAIGSGRT